MGRISKYTEIAAPDVDDLLIGTDVENGNETKNFTIQSIADLVSVAAGITPTLQQVTTAGSITTYDITANKFKKPGGTSSQILAANGDTITAGTNITITAGVISSTGSGQTDITYTPSPTNGAIISSTGADATIPLADSTNAGLFSPTEKTTLSGLVTSKENTLGNPSVSGYVLSSTTAGTRTWIENGTGAGSGVTAVTATGPITSSGGNTPVIYTTMSTNKLIGRSTAGTGVMEQITIGSGLSLSSGVISTVPSTTGTILNDLPTLESNVLTTASVSTGWTGTGFASGYTHTTGNTSALQTVDEILFGSVYQVSYTISGGSVGTVSISIGGESKSNVSSTGVFIVKALTGDTLTITPTSTFNKTIIVTLRKITPSLAIVDFRNSTGVIENEFRYSTNSLLAIGFRSGIHSLGTHNLFIGEFSGYANVTGLQNTFIGHNTGLDNISGQRNIFIGYDSGRSNKIGDNNTFLGSLSGSFNTSVDNVFIGASSGYSNTTGPYNVFVGANSGYLNSNGSNNTFLGTSSGASNTSGAQNIFLGSYSGSLNTTGAGNVFIGMSAAGVTDSDNFSIIIGDNAVGLGTGTTVIGNTDTTSTTLGGAVSIQTGIFAIPNASAQLDVVSTTKGFLPPRMTTTQINAIVSPANGLVVFNTTLNTICFFTTTWQKVTSTAM